MGSGQDYFDPSRESRRVVSTFGEVNKRQISESQHAADVAEAKKKDAEKSRGGSSQESTQG